MMMMKMMNAARLYIYFPYGEISNYIFSPNFRVRYRLRKPLNLFETLKQSFLTEPICYFFNF